MTKDKKFKIRCDVCGFTDSAASKDSAQVAAAQHATKSHGDVNQTHMMGAHLHIKES